MTDGDKRFGFFGVVREVGWAFLGVRDRANFERTTRSSQLHIVLAGLLLTGLLIAVLVTAVQFALGDRRGSGSTQTPPGEIVVNQQRGE